jgi:hypothetical protein
MSIKKFEMSLKKFPLHFRRCTEFTQYRKEADTESNTDQASEIPDRLHEETGQKDLE